MCQHSYLYSELEASLGYTIQNTVSDKTKTKYISHCPLTSLASEDQSISSVFSLENLKLSYSHPDRHVLLSYYYMPSGLYNERLSSSSYYIAQGSSQLTVNTFTVWLTLPQIPHQTNSEKPHTAILVHTKLPCKHRNKW